MVQMLLVAAAVVAGEYENVIHPGNDDGSGFWNERSVWFMYAPAFGFGRVDGAVKYRFTVTDAKGVVRTFESARPTESLAGVWDEIPTGDVKVRCEGLATDGLVKGLAGERAFWKAEGFREGAYPPALSTYHAAAKGVYDYVFDLESTRHLLETGEFDLRDPICSYASKMGAALIGAMTKCAETEPDRRELALRIARRAADRLLAISEPADAPLAYFPPTYAGPGEGDVGKSNAGRIMLVYPARVASSYVKLWKATQEKRYLDAAERIAETYLKLQGEDGTWYLKMSTKDGKPANPNRLVPINSAIPMFETLFEVTGKAAYRAAADRAFASVDTTRLNDWNWEGQFEDVAPKGKYKNLTLHDAGSTVVYLGERFPSDKVRLKQMRDLARFCEDQFVCWTPPCDGGPVRHLTTWKASKTYGEWQTPCALEQYECYWPIDSSAAKMIGVYLALYKAEGRPEDLAKAKALGDSMTRMQRFGGRIPTWWHHADGRGNDWLNCMLGTASALDALSAVSETRPAPADSLLKRMRSGVDTIGIVHFSINTFTDREWGFGSESPDDFAPTAFDAEQIVKACRDGGIQGLVIVAKHHDGFCLWPTKTTSHNISKSKWMEGKGDYVGAMEKACRKYGLKFGVYCSPWDRNNAAYATPAYVKTYHAQVEELNDGRYGEIFEMWFDGANGGDGYYGGAWEKRSIGKAAKYYDYARLLSRVRELQPDVCFFGGSDFCWPGNERGRVPPDSGGTRDHGRFGIYEADFPLRAGWFYHASQDGSSRSGEFLMKIYLRTVGNGATMDIGIAPDRRGLLTDEDVGCLKRFGKIRTDFFSKPVASASTPFNVIVMTEDISRGERVDAWRILLDGRELAAGGKIGTKRIRVLDKPVSGQDLKLEITKGEAKAEEIRIALYAADEDLVRKVMASEEPKRPPAPTERVGTLASRTPTELVYGMKHAAETSLVTVTPDATALDGTPIVFTLAYSTDGANWTALDKKFQLDNVAANPIPQTFGLGKTIKVKYLKLTVERTLKAGSPANLKALEFLR